MAHCPGCQKFPSLETGEPEVDSLAVDDKGRVTCAVRIVRVSACCGEEMKETTLELDADLDVSGHQGEGHELEAEEAGAESTERSDGKGRPSRYTRSYYGASVTVKVTCSCGAFDEDVVLEDDVQASAFEELT